MADRLLPAWTPEQQGRYAREVVTFRHRLAESGLFEDAALAALIDRQPRRGLTVCTMPRNPPPGETWIAGEAQDLSGAEILEAVRRGALWVSVRNVADVDDGFRALFAHMMQDFARETKTRIWTAATSLLISGPQMGIFFHVDVANTMLWHVRGHKTIYIYPATEDFIPQKAMEAIILKENLSDAPWRPDMEPHAQAVALAPGEGAAWPLHGPHRVLNGPDLNVSLTVEYSTAASLMENGVLYTQGVMRRRMGASPDAARTPAALKPAYWAASKALQRLAPPAHNAESAHRREFDVDLAAPDCVRWREGCGPRAAA